ncbi:MAG TPA: HepT-like ribonuclease domain-containing protein [Thermoanaerobaculia bacterium]|nr:HepT-like ribonuclease domain-containing protein [Thermoanaerobaculia bacterium]
MQPDRRDAALIADMVQFAEEVRILVQRIRPIDYLQDLATRRAIERCVELVGEAADHVSEGFQLAHPEIPWREIIAQRHRLIHGYRDIDPERTRNVVDRRLPMLVDGLRALLPASPPDPEPES